MIGERIPYVGTGADGCRRSAEIDRTEIDTLPTGPHQPGWSPATDERRLILRESASQWEAQARTLEGRQDPGGAPGHARQDTEITATEGDQQ